MIMIIWFRHLPKISMDMVEWIPFIKSKWFRRYYMKFVYLLQIIIFLMSLLLDAWVSRIDTYSLILIGLFVFIIHESLHILVINNKGDISLTFSGTFFWIHTNAVLSKMRFWFFMSLPFFALSVMPAIVSVFVSGNIKSILLFVSWINLIISASDIINSLLIAIKPKNSVFCRGYYRVEKS
ncbi:DUF3267 domain-containing protein [Sporosarcina sp. BI001-red]|uniref:DUF3267 domain-containing protein n=1 Tax=Sporosarcina sp. BI001-red TaxID=2282866 RepID=UPI000E2654F8|nr:DUF3267 domain-containing protein [Sporosarcina sp. BI001-red]REB06429.1 DUF3267 domain-containing protein [Sporosarcina sp. BI001-red]